MVEYIIWSDPLGQKHFHQTLSSWMHKHRLLSFFFFLSSLLNITSLDFLRFKDPPIQSRLKVGIDTEDQTWIKFELIEWSTQRHDMTDHQPQFLLLPCLAQEVLFFLLGRDFSDTREAKRRSEKAVDKRRTGEAVSTHSISTFPVKFRSSTLTVISNPSTGFLPYLCFNRYCI